MKNNVERKLDADCDQIIETVYQLEDLKDEYNYIERSISDLDMIEKKKIDGIKDSAAKIMEQFKEDGSSMDQSQFFLINQYQNIIHDDIARIKELEENQSVYKSQMLEEEQRMENLLVHEYRVIENKNSSKWFIISTLAMTAIMSIILIVLNQQYTLNLIPFIVIALVAGAVVSFYFINISRNSERDLNRIKRKQARSSDLHETINKRHENNRLELNYYYAKYQVKNQRELSILQEEYEKITKYDKEKFQLKQNFFNDLELIMPEVWRDHSDIFIDDSNLEKLKDYLSHCAKALKAHQSYNNKLKTKLIRNVKQLISKDPDLKNTAAEILEPYKIKL